MGGEACSHLIYLFWFEAIQRLLCYYLAISHSLATDT